MVRGTQQLEELTRRPRPRLCVGECMLQCMMPTLWCRYAAMYESDYLKKDIFKKNFWKVPHPNHRVLRYVIILRP